LSDLSFLFGAISSRHFSYGEVRANRANDGYVIDIAGIIVRRRNATARGQAN
jgi:hypothetical protein